MEFNALSEGIGPGGLRNKDEIKILICYLCSKVEKPLTIEDITNIMQSTALGNYFDCVEAFNDLIAKGNLYSQNSDGRYTVTDSGLLIASQLEDFVARSVREKAVGAALVMLNKIKLEQENEVSITKTENGYNVNCNVSGGDVNLLNFTLYVPDREQARIVKKNFHSNPAFVYNILIAALTGNSDMIKNALNNL